MITIKKIGKNEYGPWAIFEYKTESLIITGIAKTQLDKLEENHSYANLCLSVYTKNGNTYYNILQSGK